MLITQKKKLGEPHLLLSDCDKHDKMQHFASLKTNCLLGPEEPLIGEHLMWS